MNLIIAISIIFVIFYMYINLLSTFFKFLPNIIFSIIAHIDKINKLKKYLITIFFKKL